MKYYIIDKSTQEDDIYPPSNDIDQDLHGSRKNIPERIESDTTPLESNGNRMDHSAEPTNEKALPAYHEIANIADVANNQGDIYGADLEI